jgi:hypothetical protein
VDLGLRLNIKRILSASDLLEYPEHSESTIKAEMDIANDSTG